MSRSLAVVRERHQRTAILPLSHRPARLRRMGAIKDLWASERGLLCLAIIVAATVLRGLAMMTTDQWIELVKWVFVTYAAAKTVTGAFQIAKGGTADPETNAPKPVPPAQAPTTGSV